MTLLTLFSGGPSTPAFAEAAAGAVMPVWNIRLPWRIERKTNRGLYASPAESGFLHRKQRANSHSPTTRRPEVMTWTVSWPWMSETEANELRSLYATTHGGVTPFLWDPDGVGDLVPAVFAGNSLTVRRLDARGFTATVTVQETFD